MQFNNCLLQYTMKGMKSEEKMERLGELISGFITEGRGIYLMTGCFFIGFIIDILRYKNILHITSECSDIRHSADKIIKHLWMKYEGFEKTRQHVHSTRNFVDKYMFEWKICGLPVRLLTRIENLMALGCLYIGTAMGMYAYFQNISMSRSVIYTGGGVLMGLGLVMWKNVLGIEDKYEHLAVCLTYSLECMASKSNVVSVIGENTKQDIKQKQKQNGRHGALQNKNRNGDGEGKQNNVVSMRKDNKDTENRYNKNISVSEEEEIIKEVLDEFLV